MNEPPLDPPARAPSVAQESPLLAGKIDLRKILEAAPEAVLLVSGNLADRGRILDVNARAVATYGYTVAELRQLRVLDLDGPEAAPLAAGRLARVIAGESLVFEVEHRRKDGTGIPVEVTCRIADLEGRVCILAFIRDLTERRRAEAVIARDQERLRGIIEASPVPMAVNDAAHRITFLNRAFTAAFGYTAEDLPDLAAWWPRAYPSVVYREQVMAEWQQELERSRRTGTDFSPKEIVVCCRDGSTKTVLAHATPVAGSDSGEHLVVLYDISMRIANEAALRAADARWRFALEGAGDGIWDCNLESDAVYFSPRWKSMLGYAEHELADAFGTWRALVHPDDLAGALATVEAHQRGETEQTLIEHRMRCKDGSWKWIRARGKVIEWAAPGRPRRMIGTHTDIDQSKRREEAERLLAQRLNLALQAGRFGLFHRDLRTDVAVWDDRAYEIFGLQRRGTGPTRAEIAEILLPEYHEVWRRGLAAAQAGQESIALEFVIRRPSGELRNVVGRAVIQTAADGSGAQMTGVFDDITERRQADEERKILLERYDTVFQSVSEGLALHRVDGQVVDCNPAAEQILGLTRRQFLGIDPFDPRWRAINSAGEPLVGAEHPVMVATRTNRPVRGFMMGIERSDGGRTWLSVNAEPIRDLAGRVTHVVASFTDFTAQRLAEEESKRANERLQAAVTASRIVWWEWEILGGDFRVNAFGQPCILGYGPEQMAGLTGAHWLEWTHPEDRAAVKSSLDEVLAGRVDTWISKHRLKAADGSWRWVRHVGRVSQRAADGRAQLMVGTTQDQHDHYEAELLARSNAERLRIALGASAMGIWRYNLQTAEAEWDPRQRELFGLPQAAPAPTMAEFLAMLVPDDTGKVRAAWEAVTPDQPNFEYGFRIVLPSGAIRHIRSVGMMQFDATGRPDWATGINEDDTDERQQALMLGELNGRLQLALRAARFGVWEIDLETKKVTWDDALYGIYGLTPAEFGGALEVFRALVHPEDRERMVREDDQLLAGVPARPREFRIRRRSDGVERIIEAISYVVRNPAGEPVRLVGLDRDVTEQREAESKQRQLEAQLIQAQKLETLGTLAGGIAHDFNNLLTGVLGFIDLTLHALPAGDEAAEYLRNAREGSMRARELVKRLLLFARRAPATSRQPVQLGQLVVETLPLLTATLPSSIVIHTQLEHGVGPVLADAGQLQQVLMNLCINAAHAIGGRQGKITVELGALPGCPLRCVKHQPGPYARLAVADNGCGMDAATQARVFDPFFTTKGQGEGTGLGLSIVHGIVHEHGGCIRLQSEVGVGTCFEIFLPLCRKVQPDAVAVVAELPSVAGAGRRVLLADDEDQVRRLVGAVLQRSGFVLDSCNDGTVAAEHFAAAPDGYAVALLDLSMPGRTGLELIAEFRARRPKMPIILMSGDHERYGHPTQQGAAEVVLLGKPFSVEELRVALRRALGP